MKKFIINISIFFCPIIILVPMFEGLLRKIPNDYSYKKNYLDQNSTKIEKLFLGSSHAYYGINPEFISGNAFNSSFVSQSLDYDLEILKHYEGHWNNLELIAIPVDYFSLFSRLSMGQESWRGKNYKIYFDSDIDVDLKYNLEILTHNLTSNFERLNSHYINGSSFITCSNLGFGKKIRSRKNLYESGVTAAKRHTQPDLSLFSQNLALLQEFIKFGDKYDITIFLYTSPAYGSYVEHLNENQLVLTIQTVQKLAEQNSNCVYFNFLSSADFDESDYSDADHLNNKGAQKFSRIIDEKINRLLDQ